MNPNDATKRSHKHNNKQRKYLIDYMHSHREFAAGRFIGARGKEKGEQLWKDLTRELNSLGFEKTQLQWQKSRFKLSVFCDGGNSVVDILLMAFFKAWKDIKTRVRAKAVGLKNARLKTGNFPIDGNALSEEELMILGLVGPAATEGCRVPDTMPEEMSAITQLREADESVLHEIPTEISVFDEYNIVARNSMIESDMAIAQEEKFTIENVGESQSQLFTQPGTSVDVACGNDGIHMTSSSQKQSHPSSQQTTPNIETAARPVSAPCKKRIRQKDDVFKTVLQIQEKQNEILERMSQAMLITAKNESKRLELEKEKLEVKRQTCQALNSIAAAMTGYNLT